MSSQLIHDLIANNALLIYYLGAIFTFGFVLGTILVYNTIDHDQEFPQLKIDLQLFLTGVTLIAGWPFLWFLLFVMWLDSKASKQDSISSDD